ncbi:hypothetical protein L6452_03017 [Arctium lappa]|uniref:Uncharacterized protein n=1 Tax=Arctium lappa TaxID=4217 RepID=A0ACB9FLJ8_ARCLA|nr:hypothetical protein L6452_03017 [Arctium lappa]
MFLPTRQLADFCPNVDDNKPKQNLNQVINPIQKSLGIIHQLYLTVFPLSSPPFNACNSPVAVLFSGVLDSMILAALLDECLDPKFTPDRISARAGVIELKKKASLRRWNLDLNIGIALWLAAGGDGWVCEDIGKYDDSEHRRFRYKSDSKILLVGSGVDEQCAGYDHHKTKYRQSGWAGLNVEMKLDMRRIWKRNLGRNDRCIVDNGREARFPFLDEDVIRVLLDIPLWEIADLRQPSGVGDKKILREVCIANSIRF